MHLVAQGLSCRLGSTKALDDITFSLPAGSRCVVAGPSGAGKTTLLRVFAGLQPATRGRIFMGEQDVTHLPPEDRRCGWVGSEPGLIPTLDVTSQVELPLRLAGREAPERRAMALQCLDAVGLSHLLGRLPHQLSSGESLRVAIARALAGRPRHLLLDEPFARIDATQRLSLRRMLSRFQADTGCMVIESSHGLQEAIPGASHIAILRDGQMAQFGEAESVWRHPASPWVMDFLSRLPNWWSTREDRAARGWHGEAGGPSANSPWMGVRLDLAAWHILPPQGPALGPLRVEQVCGWGGFPHVEAVFPDGEPCAVPLRGHDTLPKAGDVGWAGFGWEAVAGFDEDDRRMR